MTDITIPPEAVEAAWPHVCEAGDPRLPTCKEPCSHCLAGATAALRAGIAAWPSKTVHNDHLHWPEYPHIMLPLPQEKTNADA